MDSNIVTVTDAFGSVLVNSSNEAYYVPVIDDSEITKHYIAVIDSKTRPTSIDISSLDVINSSSNIDSLKVFFDETPGWLVLAEPAYCPLRIKWFVTVLNNGAIGGSHEGFDPNLFPDPIYVNYEGRSWRVYLSSYITKVSSEMFFNSN